MPKQCPYCELKDKSSHLCSRIIRFGSYYRTSDAKTITRFRCLNCKRSFSNATFNDCFRQKKRHKNEILRRLLGSGNSLRRSAKILNINRITVVRKFIFLGGRAEFRLALINFQRPKATVVEFDDLETFEHTKCKPLSVTLAVESPSRRILGFAVSEMKAKGLLTKKAKKYGPRKDGRSKAREYLFRKIHPLVVETALIKSDKNPHYERDVFRFFPKAKYSQYKGKRGANTGQGELKKTKFDPLFSLNHTCAKMRADINRLFRKTWCTTKKKERLYLHLCIFADLHNEHLANQT
jgi:transposase-like protein